MKGQRKDYLSIGIFGVSRKKQEKRLPIHPEQIEWIDENIRAHMFFEENYGGVFGMDDSYFSERSAGVRPRSFLMDTCDIALIAKPVLDDFNEMREGMIHWGWPHCVQQRDITQAAIDRRLTLIAWEAMHKWSSGGDWQMHIFHQNNEIAGYAGVQHAMNLLGIDGHYGPQRKAAVISFGSVSRGAIRALQTRGVLDITVYTQRHYLHVANQMAGITYKEIDKGADGSLQVMHLDQDPTAFLDDLTECDLIVNGILQDTDDPLMFVDKADIDRLKPRCLIVDISCDEGMGFSFARPTSFEDPIFKKGQIYYYGVDHTPSYLWNAASWEISKSLLPFLPIIMGGPDLWEKSETIRRAIEIQEGKILNPKIISFQGR